MTTIIGVKLENRHNNSQKLQEIATKFGCSIKTRIGLHEVSECVCSHSGLILFEVINKAAELEKELKTLEGAVVKVMAF